MKVELNKIRLGISAISEECFAGILNKDETMWLDKVNVHDHFVHAVIQKWQGQVETVEADDGTQYEISVKVIKPKK